MFSDQVMGWLIVFVAGFLAIFLAVSVITVLIITLLHSTLKYTVQLHEMKLKSMTQLQQMSDTAAENARPPPRRRTTKTAKTPARED